jgi:NDP-sugar pyrophosphorylase family protein
MKAMVLAAGLGRRLLPLTRRWPKCLMPVANQPLLGLALEQLRRQGAEQVVVNTHHLAPEVQKYLRAFWPHTSVSHEPVILGTGGALAQAADFFQDEPFWLRNADVLSKADLGQLSRVMRENKAIACLGVVDDSRFNSLAMDQQGFLLGVAGYQEFQYSGRLYTYAGLACFAPRFLAYLPPVYPSSLVEAWLAALAAKEKIMTVVLKEDWNDLGTWRQLWQANYELGAGEDKILLTERGAEVKPGAVIEGFCFMSANSRVEAGAWVKNSLLLPRATVTSGAVVENAIIGKGFQAKGVLRGGAFA